MASRSGYSTTQISLHWLILLLVAIQLVFAENMTEMVDAVDEGKTVAGDVTLFGTAHYWIGIGILALMLARLGLRLFRGVPTHAGERSITTVLATAIHGALYVVLIGAPILGLIAYYGLADVGDLHALVRPALFVLVGLHIVGALVGQFIRKDGTLSRMLRPAA